ncbi:MAG: lysozyme [Treponema sp.]|nr:lysozyme [Treponema sp.]
MKKKQNYFNLETYDYTPYARELTEEEMYLVNGGRRMIGDRTNESEHVSSRPASSNESGTSTTSNSVSAETQTTTGSSQTYSSSQQNNTESQPQTSSVPTCTAAQMAAAQGAAMNAYFAEQDKKREENNKQNNNSGSSSSSTPVKGQNLPEDTMEKIYNGEDPFRGRESPLTPAEQAEMARQQAELYRNGVTYTPSKVDGLSDEGKDFISTIEGFEGDIYDAEDKSHKYQKGDTTETGDWTIGYGHKLTNEELENGTYEKGIDETKGKEIFAEDVRKFEDVVKQSVLESYELTQYQFDALVSAAYILGDSGFDKSEIKNVLRKYGNQNFSYVVSTEDFKKDMSDAFRFHIPAAGDPTNAGIKKRRYNEAQLFMYGDYVYDETPQYLMPWRAGTIVERREP